MVQGFSFVTHTHVYWSTHVMTLENDPVGDTEAYAPLRQWCWVEFHSASIMAGHGQWRVIVCQLVGYGWFSVDLISYTHQHCDFTSIGRYEVVVCSQLWNMTAVFFISMLGEIDLRCWVKIISTQPQAVIPCIETWWRHPMETFSKLLAICAGNSSVTGEFPTQRPVTRSFDAFFDLPLNERLSKQSWGWI